MSNSETPQIPDVTPEAAAVPPAVEAASQSLLRRVIERPVDLGRNVVKIMMNGDLAEALSSSASHLH